jgi:serine/threonine protein kinase
MPPTGESTSLLTELTADQERRWRDRQGEPLFVEVYLTQRPELHDRPDLLRTLVLNELLLRSERGETLLLHEYERLYPSLADDLPELFGRLATLRFATLLVPDLTTTETPSAGLRRRQARPPARLPEVPGYEVLDFLAAGGQGDVYRARHLLLRRVVALKILNQRADDDEVLARFSREGRLAALLDHPNVLRIYDCARHEGRLYITMEFAGGGSLSERLESGPLPPTEAAVLVRTLARAVHHLFTTHQIVHRDLKPSNVLFLSDGTPKVADFGLAKRLTADATRLTGGSEVLGTASYMAPEQAAGKTRDVTAATDVYALGAILYECLTGEPPFRGESWLETIDMVRHQAVTPPSQRRPGIPPVLERICLHCLAKAPADRYPVAAQLVEDLERFLTGAPLAASSPEILAALRPRTPNPEAPSSGEMPAVLPVHASDHGLSRPSVPGYEILNELGQGDAGTVYRARQPHLNRNVALKVLHPGRNAAERWKRLQAEAAQLAGLHHPNIAAIYDLGLADGRFYVATEFVPGRNLQQFTGNPNLPIGTVAELVQQIAAAAGFCHARGIVHRNLKPSNVLLAPPEGGSGEERHDSTVRVFGVPKITDFEQARVLSGPERKSAVLGRLLPTSGSTGITTRESQVFGSAGYMAPEQATDDATRHSPASDVWSLGVILYELLTGESPFEGSDDRIDPPSRYRGAVPWDLDAVCMRCLEQQPDRRFADGNELAKGLGDWLARWRRWPSNWWRRLMFWRDP